MADPVLISDGLPLPIKVRRQEGYRTSFGAVQFTPAATPTDILAIIATSYDRVLRVDRIVVSAVADAAAVVDVLAQQVAHHNSGTAVGMNAARQRGIVPFSPNASPYASSGAVAQYYTANKTSNGDGVSSSRPILASRKMLIGTPTSIGTQAVFDWPQGTGPEVRDLVNSIVVNLRGQSLPANCKINIDEVVVTEMRLPRVTLSGDSHIGQAGFFWNELNQGDVLSTLCALDNLGYSGTTLDNYLNGTGGNPYPQSAVVPERASDVILFGHLTNDVRLGAVSQALATARLESAVSAVATARPDTKIILYSPSMPAADDPTAGNYLSLTGEFAGLTMTQAAKKHGDIVYNAYQSFAADPRVFAVVHSQDVLGRTAKTVAELGTKTDQLHENERGQRIKARQLRPVLLAAIAARMAEINT